MTIKCHNPTCTTSINANPGDRAERQMFTVANAVDPGQPGKMYFCNPTCYMRERRIVVNTKIIKAWRDHVNTVDVSCGNGESWQRKG